MSNAPKPRTLLSSAVGRVAVSEAIGDKWRVEVEYSTMLISRYQLRVLQDRIADILTQIEERDANQGGTERDARTSGGKVFIQSDLPVTELVIIRGGDDDPDDDQPESKIDRDCRKTHARMDDEAVQQTQDEDVEPFDEFTGPMVGGST